MIPARSLCPNQNRQMALFAHIATPTETQLAFSQDALSHCLETAFLYLRALAGSLFPAFSFLRLKQCAGKIGRASCRERVCQQVSNSVVAVTYQKTCSQLLFVI